MRANKRRHLYRAQNNEAVTSEVVVSGVQILEGPERPALTEDPAPGADCPEGGVDGADESQETVVLLLRAIQGTEIARRLGVVATPLEERQDVPAPATRAADGPGVEATASTGPADATREDKELQDASPCSPAADGAAESGGLVANLLRAIQGTEMAASLGAEARAAGGAADASMRAEPPVAAPAELSVPDGAAETGTAEPEMESPVAAGDRAAVAEPERDPVVAAADMVEPTTDPAVPAADVVATAPDFEGRVAEELTAASTESDAIAPAEAAAAVPGDVPVEAEPALLTTAEPAAPAGEIVATVPDMEGSVVSDPPAASTQAEPDANRAALPVREFRTAGSRRVRRRRRGAKVSSKTERRIVEADGEAQITPACAGQMPESVELQPSQEAPTVPALPSAEVAEQPIAAIPAEMPAAAEPAPVFVASMFPTLPQSPAVAESASGVAESAAVEDSGEPAQISNGSTGAPILARLGGEITRLPAKIGQLTEGLDRAEMHLETWFQKWFGPPDPRGSRRVDKPPLVAYHWIVDSPQALKIANISAGGLYLLTEDRWSEGNIVSMTLQRTDRPKGSPDSWIAVDLLVLRWCEDGLAGAFIPAPPDVRDAVAGRAKNCANRKMLESFVKQLAMQVVQ